MAAKRKTAKKTTKRKTVKKVAKTAPVARHASDDNKVLWFTAICILAIVIIVGIVISYTKGVPVENSENIAGENLAGGAHQIARP